MTIGLKELSMRAVLLAVAVAISTVVLTGERMEAAAAHEEEAVPDTPTVDAETADPDPIADNAPIETELDLNDAEVVWYAERHGISRERSLEIANWMTEIAPEIEDLNESLEGNYADVRVVHGGARGDPTMAPGRIRVDLRLVDPDTATAQAAIDAIEAVNSRIADVDLEVMRVPKSLKALEDAAAAVQPLHRDKEVDFDFDRGTLLFKPLPPPAEPTGHDCPNAIGRFEGGRPLGFDKDGGGCDAPGIFRCTSGLGGFMSSRFGITTAGHCFNDNGWAEGHVQSPLNQVADSYFINNPNNLYASGYPYFSDQLNDDDGGFIARRLADTDVPASIYKHDTNEWRLTTHHEASARAMGLTLCMSASPVAENGANTYCGEVIDPYTHPVNPALYTDKWTALDMTSGDFKQGEGWGKGGSGGPAFWGGTA